MNNETIAKLYGKNYDLSKDIENIIKQNKKLIKGSAAELKSCIEMIQEGNMEAIYDPTFPFVSFLVACDMMHKGEEPTSLIPSSLMNKIKKALPPSKPRFVKYSLDEKTIKFEDTEDADCENKIAELSEYSLKDFLENIAKEGKSDYDLDYDKEKMMLHFLGEKNKNKKTAISAISSKKIDDLNKESAAQIAALEAEAKAKIKEINDELKSKKDKISAETKKMTDSLSNKFKACKDEYTKRCSELTKCITADQEFKEEFNSDKGICFIKKAGSGFATLNPAVIENLFSEKEDYNDIVRKYNITCLLPQKKLEICKAALEINPETAELVMKTDEYLEMFNIKRKSKQDKKSNEKVEADEEADVEEADEEADAEEADEEADEEEAEEESDSEIKKKSKSTKKIKEESEEESDSEIKKKSKTTKKIKEDESKKKSKPTKKIKEESDEESDSEIKTTKKTRKAPKKVIKHTESYADVDIDSE